MSDASCNILVIGKSGVGKSSLINRIFNTQCKTGTGKPVTGHGVYSYDVTVDSMKAVVFDSWGIEPGSTEEWKKLLDQALLEHGGSRPPKDWFHAVVYCIDASGKRIQSFDTDIIGMLLKSGFHLSIVLTKSDLATAEEREKMKADLVKSGFDSARIIFFSSGGETRFEKTLPFGISELKEQMFGGWQKTIVQLLPKRCCRLLLDEITDFGYRSKHLIDALDFAFWDNKANEDLIRHEVDFFQRALAQYIAPAIINRELAACFRISYVMIEADKNQSAPFSAASTALSFEIIKMLTIFSPGVVVVGKVFSPFSFLDPSSTVRTSLKAYIDLVSRKMKEQCSSLESDIRDKLQSLIAENRKAE